jgi:hypothetical protein
MKLYTALALFGLASCDQRSPELKVIDTAIFDDFLSVAEDGKFDDFATRIHPGILKAFRMRLEFTTSSPLEGSWFTGSEDRLPTKNDLDSMSDTEFFVRFMNGYRPVLGNPFKDTLTGLQVIAATTGTKGYRNFIAIKETDYAIPTTLSFSQVNGRWILVGPSFVENFANRLRAARGQTPEA